MSIATAVAGALAAPLLLLGGTTTPEPPPEPEPPACVIPERAKAETCAEYVEALERRLERRDRRIMRLRFAVWDLQFLLYHNKGRR